MYGCFSTCWLCMNDRVWRHAFVPHTCGVSGGCSTELPYELDALVPCASRYVVPRKCTVAANWRGAV